MEKTIGEKTFEQYLNLQGIADYEFEKIISGKKRPPDYTISFEGRDYLFEVKDFEPKEITKKINCISYDPHAGIRERIDRARKKFKEYKDMPCILVLCNNDQFIDITYPDFVLGAMYGNLGVVIPFNPETGESIGERYIEFLSGGKMIRPHWKKPANTRLSAIVTLRYISIGEMRYRKHIDSLSQKFTKCKTGRAARVAHVSEIYQQLENTQVEFDEKERHLGIIVWENAFASIPFPRNLFCGKYDEIYGVENERLARVFAGQGVLEYEEIRASLKTPSLVERLASRKNV